MRGKQTRPGETEAGKNSLAADTILAQTLANADGWWRDCAERALGWLAEGGFEFTAFDLTELGVPDPDHPNRWGSLFSAAHKRGLIECVGFRVSPRQSRQGGICRVWRGVPDRLSVVATPLSKVTVGRVDLDGLTPLSQVATGVPR